MTISAKCDFAWYLTFHDRPTSWSFVWYLHCLISASVHNSCVNSLAVLINVADCRSLNIRRISYNNRLVLSIASNLGCGYFALTCSVTWYSWDIVACPFTSCPVTVSYFASDFVNVGIASQLNFLCSCLSLAIWSCNFDRTSNRLVQVIMTNTTWISLTWVVWQLVAWCLWLIWSDSYMLVTNRYHDISMTIGTKGDFSWHLTLSDCPTSWHFVWYLHCLISLTSDRCHVDSLVIAINVVNMSRLIVSCVS